MIKEIVKDSFFLSQISTDADQKDLYVVDDLVDTIKAHADHCVGIAANMIGVLKRVIVILDENRYLPMINPVIVKASGRHYETEEGCLCHAGEKKIKRYEKMNI